MDNESHTGESRILDGPGTLKVHVPATPPQRPEDLKRDFPPGDPPEVYYLGASANYWIALREGRMPYRGGVKVFSDEQMQWLRSVKADVESLLR